MRVNFLEIFDSIADHVLPLTVEGGYGKARFAAEVNTARKPALSRVPNHSAQVAETKTKAPKAGDKGGKPSGKKSTGSQPQGRRVVHFSRENVGKPQASHRKVAVREATGQPKWTDASRAAVFNPTLHC